MVADLHPDAYALTAVRLVGDDELRHYTATTFARDPWQGCERMIRMARAVGYVASTKDFPQPYAVLDVLASNGDIMQDFAIPHARAWRWWYRKLNLRVEEVPDGR